MTQWCRAHDPFHDSNFGRGNPNPAAKARLPPWWTPRAALGAPVESYFDRYFLAWPSRACARGKNPHDAPLGPFPATYPQGGNVVSATTKGF